jgi:hypothetical protein
MNLTEQVRDWATRGVLQDVLEERRRQFDRYGTNADTEDGTGPNVQWLWPFARQSAHQIEEIFRDDYLAFERHHPVTWAHLVREEVAEAFAESDPERLEAELIQVAALCVSWVEKIRARS